MRGLVSLVTLSHDQPVREPRQSDDRIRADLCIAALSVKDCPVVSVLSLTEGDQRSDRDDYCHYRVSRAMPLGLTNPVVMRSSTLDPSRLAR